MSFAADMHMSPDTRFEPVVGLEVHAELQTRSKMFCACPVVDPTSADPNTAVCEVCTGMPGTLPVINERAVEFALRAALALNSQVAPTSVFARKNYFYPDLPKGFQISQYEMPLATGGWLEIEAPQGSKRVAVRRVHLEEDTGKLFHQAGSSLVDFNRAGVPLLEVVSEPELFSIEEVKAYATALRTLLRYIGITSGDMEKGAIRFEANISLRPAGSQSLGIRTEIKNLNSFRSMLRALAYEIDRHRALLASGGAVAQETLRWNESRGETYPERGKEEANDYRYFPEPDLPPLAIDPAWVERIRSSLPELPWARRNRFVTRIGLSADAAGILTAERAIADFFEAVLSAAPEASPEKVAHWVTGEVFSLLHQAGTSLVDFNRAGVPLLEVVSEPELFSIEEVKAYATALRTLLRYIGITSGDMEKGAIRFEANISLRPAGSQSLGIRTEIKNLNSFRSMLRALAYEIDRHRALLASGGAVAQETLRWNESRGETYPERGKEEANDYRYFPEPDLPPLAIDPAWVERIRSSLPELPWARRNRFVTRIGLSADAAGILTAERAIADFFEAVLSAAPEASPEKVAHWVTGEVFSLLHQAGIEIQASRLSPGALAQIISLSEDGRLTLASAKEVLAEVFRTGEAPLALVEQRGLSQVSDREMIEGLVREVLDAHPSQVDQYLAGKRPILEWLFGQVMRSASGRANPAVVRAVLTDRLRASEENRTPR
ncbi:MAG: hypothetical protein A2Z66_03630 [Chloroflexi bacterium RBG_13_66_10]|nr:MAG: hypothetical protein A2Z66_03630 [Chloroflexi bacterium RBG_13_66_10]